MIVAAMSDAFCAENIKMPERAAVLSVVGLSLDAAVARLMPEGTSHAQVHRMAEAYKASFGARRRMGEIEEPLYAGLRDLILDLAKRPDVKLGVATGKSLRGLRIVLEREGLMEHFATLQTADSHPSKPHPSMITTARNETGVKVHNTVMIGDTTFDIEMARAANAHAIGVSWGYHPVSSLISAGAHHVVHDCDSLAASLDRFLAAKTEA